MTPLEVRAIDALHNCSMRLGSSGKRFRRNIEDARRSDPEFKLTAAQALYLWQILHTYRRQVPDGDLREYAAHAYLNQELPEIYSAGDHRELPGTPSNPALPTTAERREQAKRIADERLKQHPCKCGVCWMNLYLQACNELLTTPEALLKSRGSICTVGA